MVKNAPGSNNFAVLRTFYAQKEKIEGTHHVVFSPKRGSRVPSTSTTFIPSCLWAGTPVFLLWVNDHVRLTKVEDVRWLHRPTPLSPTLCTTSLGWTVQRLLVVCLHLTKDIIHARNSSLYTYTNYAICNKKPRKSSLQNSVVVKDLKSEDKNKDKDWEFRN